MSLNSSSKSSDPPLQPGTPCTMCGKEWWKNEHYLTKTCCQRTLTSWQRYQDEQQRDGPSIHLNVDAESVCRRLVDFQPYERKYYFSLLARQFCLKCGAKRGKYNCKCPNTLFIGEPNGS